MKFIFFVTSLVGVPHADPCDLTGWSFSGNLTVVHAQLRLGAGDVAFDPESVVTLEGSNLFLGGSGGFSFLVF